MGIENRSATANQIAGSRTNSALRSLLRMGIAVVLLCISAGISIPLQPVPFTLQILVLGVIVATMKPSEAISAVAAYVAIGALGAPVFSGYVGGITRLVGGSGGFIYGFIAGVAAGTFLRVALERTALPKAVSAFAGIVVMTAVSYFFGWAHLVLVFQLTPAAAFVAGCAPFILADLVKAAMATAIATPVRRFMNGAK